MANVVQMTEPIRFRLPTVRTFVVPAALLLGAVALANSISEDTQIHQLSIAGSIVRCGAIPWALQLAAILTFFAQCRANQCRRCPEIEFAGMTMVSVGLTWWLYNIVTYANEDSLEAISQTIVTSVEQQLAGESLLFTFAQRICGPLIAVFQLRGLLSLAGIGFIYSLCSLFIVTGYLVLTASVCQVGQAGPTRIRDCIKFLLMMLVVFMPSLIRGGIDKSAAAL